MSTHPNSWWSPKLVARKNPAKGGNETIATAPVKRGELLTMWGGSIVTAQDLPSVPDSIRHLSVQVSDELYLVTVIPGPGDYINHSCDPNAGMYGQIGLVAMRDIEAGEEVCFDYAMTDSTSYDEFDCQCGTRYCRGRVSADDWMEPSLWKRYAGYFSPYLQKRIDEKYKVRGQRLRTRISPAVRRLRQADPKG